jgi:pimeloyl-ACP methyl ester carboxylesterase
MLPPVRILEVGGLEIAYRQLGEGPPLVLAHGAGDDSRAWQPQLAALSHAFTVIAWDEPGAGRSSRLPPGFGLEGYADCLAALIDALGLGPAHVAGLSWGGTVALALYRHHPELVAGLVLADTYAGWAGSLPAAEVRARVETTGARLAAPRDSGPVVPGLFAGAPPPEYAPLLTQMATDARPTTLAAQLAIMAEADLRDVLPRIAVPTLLIWGEQDVRSPLPVARAFAAAIPDARLVVIPACGHMSNLDRPAEFSAAVRAFCLAHPPRAA